MKNILESFSHSRDLYHHEQTTRNEFFLIAIILFIRFLMMAILLKEGFLGLSGDDFSRQIAAYSWFEDPYFLRPGWPPLQFWMLGFTLKLYPNITGANLIVNGFFSTLALVMFYLLVRRFFSKKISLVSLAIAATFPWQLRLSLSGLSEPLYYCFLFTTLFYLFTWEATEKYYAPIICGVSLLCANMLRMDAWVFYVAVSMYIMLLLGTSKTSVKKKFILFVPLLLPLSFILSWIALGYMGTNFVVFRQDFIDATSELSSTYMRFFRYPIYIFLLSPLIAIAGVAGLIPYFKYNSKLFCHYLPVPLLYLCGMIAISVITGADSLTAPLRFSLPFILLLIPLSLSLFFSFTSTQFNKTAYIYIVAILSLNFLFAFNFNRNDFVHINKVSKSVSTAWSTNMLGEQQKVFFERNAMKPFFYDHLALRVLSNRPDNFILYLESNTDYTLDQVPDDVKNGNLGALIASSRNLKNRFSNIYSDCSTTTQGPYKIFWVNNNLPISPSIKNQPEQMLNLTYSKDIFLRGYTIDRGNFPFGITTLWEINSDTQLPLGIQYKLIPRETTNKPIILNARNLADVANFTTFKKKTVVADWQELILPKKASPGRYTLALRLDKNPNSHSSQQRNFENANWVHLSEVTLLTSKRDVMNRMIQGKLTDFSVGLKVLMSLF